jgi:hypothetical protein
MLQIVLTFNPETNSLNVQSPLDAGDTVLMLERAKVAVVQAASRPLEAPPLAMPTPGMARELLEGRGKINGHR